MATGLITTKQPPRPFLAHVVDPTFMHIRRHMAAMDVLDTMNDKNIEGRAGDRASKHEIAVWREFARSQPTTLKGLLAFTEYALLPANDLRFRPEDALPCMDTIAACLRSIVGEV